MGKRPFSVGLVLLIGLAIAASGRLAAQASSAAAPVVLIHGWHGAGPSDSLAGSSLAPLGALLAADGHDVIWADGVAVDPGHTLFDSADALGAVVERVAQRHPDQPVRLIGHSYGGLVARAFLETERYRRLQRRDVHVSHLVTLGTPMGGIDLWLPLLFVLGDPLGEPSVWELTPAWMEQFNRSHTPPAGTRYTLIAGDARSQVPLLWLLPASDGAVTLASAHVLPERTLRITELRSADVHTSTDYTRLLRWRSLVDNADTYRRLVRPGLLADGHVRDTAAAAAPAPAAAGYSHTPVQSLRLAPGETRDLSLAQDSAAALLIAAEGGVQPAILAPGAFRPDGWPAGSTLDTLPLAGAEGRRGGWGALAPVREHGVHLRFTNSDQAERRVTWLGVLPPRAPRLRLSARGTDFGLALRLSASEPGLEEAVVVVQGQDGLRRPAAMVRGMGSSSPEGGVGLSGILGDVAPGIYYIQATANVGGQAIQTELTVSTE